MGSWNNRRTGDWWSHCGVLTWRWTFYINLPFCGIGFVMVPLLVKFETRSTSLREKLMELDWLGGFLFMASTTGFLVSITWGSVQYPWDSWHVLVPLFVSLAGILATLAWEKYAATQSFIKLLVFQKGSAGAAYICGLTQGLMVS